MYVEQAGKLLELLKDYIRDYTRLLEGQLNAYTAPLVLQYRSEIQDILDILCGGNPSVPFNIKQDAQLEAQRLQEYDQKLRQRLREIYALLGASVRHYRGNYPREHWWWFV